MKPRRLFLSLAMALPLPALAQAPAEPIRWRSGPSPLLPRTAGTALPDLAAAGERHLVVQLGTAASRDLRTALRERGLRLLRPLGSGGYFAVLEEGADLAALAADPALAGIERVRSEWKIHPDLAAGAFPSWSVVEGGNTGNPVLGAYVLFHPDVDLEATARGLVGQRGGTIQDSLESLNGLVIELPLDQVPVLAALDEVQWIEPPLPRFQGIALNDSNRSITEANLVQGAPYNLDGSGVTVLVYDGGTARASHQDFGGRVSVRDASGEHFHSTHVAGTIGGDGSASGGTFRGMAPGVTIESYGFEYDGTSVFLYANPGDIETDYDAAINVFGADLASNSIGTNTETNGFSCNFQGDYGVTSALIDAIVGGSLGAPFRIVWAAGNERQGSRCDLEGFGDYYSTAPPAGAKNAIVVGALNSNDDTMTSFSSWGPTDDGRLRPDLCAPGCQSNGDFGVTSCDDSSDTSYITLCGTSMATPTVSGLSALLLEDYRAQFGSPDPRNSTLKILLAHEAVDHGNAGPDYQFGYGSVRILDTIEFLRLGQFREDSVEGTGSVFRYTVQVNPGDPELKVTMAWDDAPGTPNVLPALVNDLDLRVFDPSGLRRYPWTLDPQNPSAIAVTTAEDHRNNMEQVEVTSPMAGTWTVEVHGFDVPAGPQDFSVCSSHPLQVDSFVSIALLSGVPQVMVPGSPALVTAHITATNDTLVAGSPRIFFRYQGSGEFQKVLMTSLGNDQYEASLPPPVCGASVEWYVRAKGQSSGFAYHPVGAPAAVHTAEVLDTVTLFSDDFESNQGWTVNHVALTDGGWERGVPAGDGGRNDPLVDFDGSGSCFVTDNVAGNSDVDGGPTQILSPVFDLSGGKEYFIEYARWFANDDFDIDVLTVELSSNGGGSWTTVEGVGNTNGWAVRSFRVADFLAPTSQMALRISATDNPNDSVTEAGFDAFRIYFTECNQALEDCNQNGIVDSDDVASGRSGDANQDGIPDECQRKLPAATRP